MLVMIEVRNSYTGQAEGGDSIVGRGVIDLRRAEAGAPVLSLLHSARPLDDAKNDAGSAAKNLYESLPLAVRAALNKEQSAVILPKKASRTVACRKYWHPKTKTHNNVEITFRSVSVPKFD